MDGPSTGWWGHWEQSTCAERGEEIVEMQMGWVVHSHFVKDTDAMSKKMPYLSMMN